MLFLQILLSITVLFCLVLLAVRYVKVTCKPYYKISNKTYGFELVGCHKDLFVNKYRNKQDKYTTLINVSPTVKIEYDVRTRLVNHVIVRPKRINYQQMCDITTMARKFATRYRLHVQVYFKEDGYTLIWDRASNNYKSVCVGVRGNLAIRNTRWALYEREYIYRAVGKFKTPLVDYLYDLKNKDGKTYRSVQQLFIFNEVHQQ